jgi:hypothetical protein
MTLSELKDYIEKVCLSHKDINEFYTGSDYNAAEGLTHNYPIIFYELPYFTTYNLDPNRQIDNVQFAYNVFVKSNWDKIKEDHDAISRAKEIGDAIITYINDQSDNFKIQSADATSVREFTDDSVAGMRFELNILLPRTFCDTSDWKAVFDPID